MLVQVFQDVRADVAMSLRRSGMTVFDWRLALAAAMA